VIEVLCQDAVDHQGSHRAFDYGALDAALDGLMMQSERPTDRKERLCCRDIGFAPRPIALFLFGETAPVS
jgi:hypothetical protein